MNLKKIPLKVYIMIAVALLLGIMSVVLLIKIINNHSFVKAYEYGEYLTEKEEGLLTLNTPESYLPYYNLGNVAYEQQDYNSAIGYFTKALSLLPFGQKECSVRINLALSMVYSIDYTDLSTQDKVDTALIVLYKARDTLLENDWATADGQGHRDDDAQQLKEDIERLIDQIENGSGDSDSDDSDQEQNSNDDQDQSSDNDQSQTDREKKQKDQLDRKKKDAMEERRQEQDDLDKYYKYGSGDEDGGSLGGEGGGGYKPW
jgi:hypothetical protein